MAPISPMRDKERLKLVGVIEKAYDGPLFSPQGIFTRDHYDVSRSDAVLANFTRAKKVSIGSMFELAWAWQMKKPIVVIQDPAGMHKHPFVDCASPYVAHDLKEAVVLLTSILRNGL
jgi:nucleoside 2-deoxyribosyltransferase